MQGAKNGGLEENWLALYMSVKKNKTVSKALKLMGIITERHCIYNTKNFKKLLTKEYLKELHVNQKLSCSQIAKEMSISHTTVNRYLKEYNLHKENKKTKEITKEKVVQVYTKYNAKDAADKLGVSQTSLYNYIKKFNLKKKKEHIDLEKSKLEELYAKEKLSTYRIAKKYNCSSTAILYMLRKYNIATRS